MRHALCTLAPPHPILGVQRRACRTPSQGTASTCHHARPSINVLPPPTRFDSSPRRLCLLLLLLLSARRLAVTLKGPGAAGRH